MVILTCLKAAISIPDALFRAAETAAKRLGLSRSELYQRAIAAYLERHNDDLVTDGLNEVHGRLGAGGLDPTLDLMQRASLPREP